MAKNKRVIPHGKRERELSDYEIATIVTRGNKFETEMLLKQIAENKEINGNYFLKNKKEQEINND